MHVRAENGAIVDNVACVQYIYDKEEMKFAMKPHKSSKNGRGTPYTRTKPSIVRNLDRKLTTVGPKDAVSMATQESGGNPSQVKLCSIFVSTENILSSKEISVIKNRWKRIQIPIFIAGRIT